MNRQVVKVLQSGSIPKIYIKMISDLADLIEETNESQKTGGKKMNATNTKGFNAMKQKLRKNNKEFNDEIEKYKADKEEYMMSEEEEAAPVAVRPRKNRKERLDDLNEAIDNEGFSTVGAGGKVLVYTPESIMKHLRTIIESRGRRIPTVRSKFGSWRDCLKLQILRIRRSECY